MLVSEVVLLLDILHVHTRKALLKAHRTTDKLWGTLLQLSAGLEQGRQAVCVEQLQAAPEHYALNVREQLYEHLYLVQLLPASHVGDVALADEVGHASHQVVAHDVSVGTFDEGGQQGVDGLEVLPYALLAKPCELNHAFIGLDDAA